MDDGTAQARPRDGLSKRQRAARRIAFILYDSPATISPEVIIATLMIWWGAWLANPFWVAFTPPDIFVGLAAIADEAVWGTAALTLGSLHLWMLMGNDGRAKRLRRRRIVVVGEFVFWLMVSIGYLEQWRSTAMVVYPGLTLLCAWVFMRMGVTGSE